jgi:hypothetical protein
VRLVLHLLRTGRGDRREDLDLARLELGTQGGELVLLELVLERERLEGRLLDLAVLLGLLENGLDRCFEFDRAQFSSLPSCVDTSRGREYTRSRAHLLTRDGACLFLEQRFQALKVVLELLARPGGDGGPCKS